jgi:thioredoxin 1
MPEEDGFDAMAKRLEAALGGAEDSLANGKLNDFTDPDFMTTARKASTAVIMFYRTDCPFCKQLTPLLEDLAEDYQNKVYFGKVNVDDIEGVRDKYQILGVPMTTAFKKGTTVARIEGLRGVEVYDAWIESIHQGLRPLGADPGPITPLE